MLIMEKRKPSNKVRVNENVLSLIGNTPLIRLKKVVEGFPGEFYTKFEAFNPGHSNKDRIALHIIEEAEKKVFLNLVTQLLKQPPETLVLVWLWFH